MKRKYSEYAGKHRRFTFWGVFPWGQFVLSRLNIRTDQRKRILTLVEKSDDVQPSEKVALTVSLIFEIFQSWCPTRSTWLTSCLFLSLVTGELEDASLRAKKASEETTLLQKQLGDAQRKNKDKSDQNTTLQGTPHSRARFPSTSFQCRLC